MPVLKLYYVDLPTWRAEVCRLALHIGNVPFEDIRNKTPEQKAAFKESGKAPFGQIPILEVDGKVIAQTGAIARYCGKLGGLYPKDDDLAAAKIDEIIDTATDITMHVQKTMKMADQEKLEARHQLAVDVFPMYLKALEKIMTQNGSTGFYVGKKMTIADITMWSLFNMMTGGMLDGIPSNILDPYPQLVANKKSTGENSKIAEWVDKTYTKPSPKPVLKLYYFDFPFWRAEVSRLALNLGNVPFEDIRSKEESEGKAPFGQLPILEVDGKVIAQTGAIARYCGKLGGLYPKDDDFAAAKIDEIIDTCTDITGHIGKTMRMTDTTEKLEARKQMAKDVFPMYFKALEKMMTQNGSTGFYVGSKMTIALWRLLGWITGGSLDGLPANILDPYPQLMANMKATGANPKISAWMASHYAKA